jgi:hypothetical protein
MDSGPEPELQILENPLILLPQRPEPREVLLWNTTFRLDEKDIRGGFIKKYNTGRATYVETGEMRYFITTSNAPVIEFSRSVVRSDGYIAHGRIWAEMYRLEGDALVYKGKDFEAWYDHIARWLRRNFKRIKGEDGYFGQSALKWYQEGGKLAK